MKTLRVEVLVCGGGPAGLAAALAAARLGVTTLLLERAGFAGGIITAVGLPFFDGIADSRSGRIVTRGIALELAARLGLCAPDAARVEPHNPTLDCIERFKALADELLLSQDARLRPLYHTQVCGAETRGSRISGVLAANKDGLARIEARQVIDATGDGDIACWSGAPVEKTAPLMPLTLHFRIGNVDRAAGDFRAQARDALLRAQERGELPMFYFPGFNFPFAPSEAYVHAVRVPGDASDATELTRAEIQGRRDALVMFRCWKREVPAFRDAYYVASGPYIGARETRRLRGAYVLTGEDILARREFPDAIATGCWYLDRHPNHTTVDAASGERVEQPEPYDIPYRTLISPQVPNLLVAGRCHSTTREAASSTRVTCTAMALGEAAGTAAALAVRQDRDAADVNGEAVRNTLTARGAGPFTC